MHTHKIDVHRDGRWWMVVVPELDQITQARRVAEIEDMARSLIAISTDRPISDIAVEVTSITASDGADLLGAAREIERLRRDAQATEAKATEAARAYARKLTDWRNPRSGCRDSPSGLTAAHKPADPRPLIGRSREDASTPVTQAKELGLTCAVLAH